MKKNLRKSNDLWGGILIDLGKLTFAGVVLSTVTGGAETAWLLLLGGSVATVLALLLGVHLKIGVGED
jgi:hypothetical protein